MPTDIPAPSIAYGPLLPMLLVFGAAVVGVLIEAFVPVAARRLSQILVAILGLGLALVQIIRLAQDGTSELVAQSAIAVDAPTLFLHGLLCVLGLLSVLLLAENRLDSTGGELVRQAAALPGSPDDLANARTPLMQTEIFPLAMFAFGGMMLFAASNNLLLAFIALEVLSLPLYLMAGLARRRRLLSQEAAMKYFLLGSFSSAFFLYGVALIYGYAGGVDLGEVLLATQQTGKGDGLLLLGTAMLAIGLLFKVGAVPFHSWTPDVYQGSPTPVTALMAAGTKVAAFGALLRIFYVGFGTTTWDWRPMMWGVAILTMVGGAVLAVTQTDVKRMLAYSAVAHTGFLLVGLVATNKSGLSGTLFYLATYGFTTLAAFAIVSLVRDSAGEATHLAQWAGLGKRSPLIAGVFAFLLFALAGIPLTSGFIAKFAVFTAAVEGGATVLVVVGVLASAITAFFYARVVVLMFFTDPAEGGPTVAVPSSYTAVAITVGVVVTAVLGILPQPVLELADKASLFLR